MAGASPLCYSKTHPGAAPLCFSKRSAGVFPLVFKGDAKAAIEVTVAAMQEKVGPIKGCGNIHNVIIDGSAEDPYYSIRESYDAGLSVFSVSNVTCPAVIAFTCNSRSQGCSYPEDNPSMDFNIIALNTGNRSVATTKKHVNNVAGYNNQNIFSFTIKIDAAGKVTEVN